MLQQTSVHEHIMQASVNNVKISQNSLPFRAILWASIDDFTNTETRSKFGFPLEFAYESEQDVAVTGNHTVTQHH